MSRMNEAENAAKDVVGQVKDKASEVVGTIKDAASDQFGRIRETAGEYYDRGVHQAEEWEQTLEGCIQEKPIKSLLIAAGVGLVLGILWKRS